MMDNITLLNDSIFYSELGLINYNVFICDRSSATSIHYRGGGVVIAVKNDVSALEIPVPKFMGAEWVFLKIYFNSISYIICGVYFPPSSPVSLY